MIGERRDPALFALGALCRTLDEVAMHHPDTWLLVLFDVLDKARACEPSHELNYLVQSTIASAPTDDLRRAARTQTRRFEKQLRRQLRQGPVATRGSDQLEVLLVVPKRVERLALDVVCDLPQDLEANPFDSGIRYRRFQLPDAVAGRITCTVVCLQDAGNLLAANVVRDAVSAFGRPTLGVLCGMAMATRSGMNLGSVVVAEAIHDYAPRRVTDQGPRDRFHHRRVNEELLNELRHHADLHRQDFIDRFRQACDRGIARSEPEVVVKEERADPKVKVGVVLAGEELVEDGSGPERSAVHDRVLALEMEGAGFAYACDHTGIPWAVIRGLADDGEPDRAKDWQWTATAAAASFALSFIELTWHQPRVRGTPG